MISCNLNRSDVVLSSSVLTVGKSALLKSARTEQIDEQEGNVNRPSSALLCSMYSQ